jgi:hypothetical protein
MKARDRMNDLAGFMLAMIVLVLAFGGFAFVVGQDACGVMLLLTVYPWSVMLRYALSEEE